MTQSPGQPSPDSLEAELERAAEEYAPANLENLHWFDDGPAVEKMKHDAFLAGAQWQLDRVANIVEKKDREISELHQKLELSKKYEAISREGWKQAKEAERAAELVAAVEKLVTTWKPLLDAEIELAKALAKYRGETP